MRLLPFLPLLLAAGAAAAQTSPWYLGAAHSVTHEDNVYRLGDGVATPAGVSRSDLIATTSLLAGLDQALGRQRLYGNASLRASRFQDNRVLDNEGYGLRAGLDWSAAGRLSGNLDLRADRALARFNTDTEIGLLTRQNIENTRQAGATLRLGGVTPWTAEAAVEHRRIDYSAPEYDFRENRQTNATLGLRWRPAGNTVLGAGLRHVRGEYPRFQPDAADRYRRNGLDLTAGLDASGASRLDARLTLGRTRYEQAAQRGFSGVTGNFSWDWRPTARLRLLSRLSRDSGQDSLYSASPLVDGVIDYSRTTTSATLRLDYAATAKLRATAGLNLARRELVRTLPPEAPVPAEASGRERLVEASLGLAWEPARSLVFGCDLAREHRSVDGTLSLPYSAARLGCYAQAYLR